MTRYLVQSNPIPRTARIFGRHLENDFGLSHTVPLILHYDGDQRNIQFVWKLQEKIDNLHEIVLISVSH